MDPDLQEQIETWVPDPHQRTDDADWFPSVFEDAPFGIAAIDLEGNFVRVNKAFSALHGREAREVELLNVRDLTVSGNAADYEGSMALAREGEVSMYRNEHRIVRPDGSERWAIITASTIKDSTGQPAYALVQYHDTTTIRQIREEVREATETLDLTFENAPIAIYSVDFEGTVLTWNPMAEQVFGYSADEVLGHEIPIVPDEEREGAEGGLDRLARGETISNVEARLRHKDGRLLDVLTSASVTHSPSGEPKAIVAFAMDVTEKHRLERELRRNDKYLRLVFDKISDSVTIIDGRGRIRYSTTEFSDALGYPRDFWDDHTILDLVHPDDVRRAEQFFADVMAVPGIEFNDVVRVRTAEGDYIPVEGTGINLLDDPEVNGIIIAARDLTDYRRTQDLLADEARVLGLIARSAPLDETLLAIIEMVERHTQEGLSAIVFVDEQGRYRTGPAPHVPPELVKAIDEANRVWPIAQAVETRQTVVITDVDTEGPAGMNDDARRFGIEAGWSTPIIEPTRDQVLGVICTSYATPIPPTDHELRVAGLAANLAAIALERQRVLDELHDQAHNDQLTGLPNRTHLLQRLDEELGRSADTGGVAVLFVDLDRFKVINDSLGHTVGDRLLRRFGERLRDLVGPDGFVGRFSADDFLVVLTGVPHVSAATPVATELELALSEPFSLDVGAGEVYLSASIGMAHSSDANGTAEDLVQLAGAAMYRAKELGRDRIEVFDHHMRTRARERLQLEHDLRLAVERGELLVHYQPKIDLTTGSIIGAEALLRWHHPERGIILPTQFIPVAEETGLIVRIGRFVLEEAVSQARRWLDRLPANAPFIMAVNFSARQITAPDLVTNVARVLLKYSWPPERLSFELTESVLVDDADSTLDVLNELKRLGVRLAIDDFGTGFSSLSYLHRFPVDIVKIDRAFVSQLEADGSGSAVVTAVMHMAEALDLITSAEGVETKEQLEGLRRLGCHWAQGFLFARPLVAEEMTEMLGHAPSW
jgi:diguanylate cyclase (GGDEF)-like protein/PAS domain S-box-containing protein